MVYVKERGTCKLQYVGCTIHLLRVSISEQCNDMKNLNAKNICNVSIDFKENNNRNMNSFSFIGIEKAITSARGEDMHRKLQQREVWWIHALDTGAPSGLNYRWDLDLFLK